MSIMIEPCPSCACGFCAQPPNLGAPHELAVRSIPPATRPSPPPVNAAQPAAMSGEAASASPALTWPLAIPLADGGFMWVPMTLPDPQPASNDQAETRPEQPLDAGPAAEPYGHDATRTPSG